MNQFFAELTGLGAKLEFFQDGPMRLVATDKWLRRKDDLYHDLLKCFDAVDNNGDVSILIRFGRLPFLYCSTLKQVAMNHGRLHCARTKECDQELASFASKCEALAVLSDDTDFLIYEGSWRLWCISSLHFNELTTTEYDRTGLARFLRLTPLQMPLLGTLAGNDVVNQEALKRFHCQLGKYGDKIANVAKFIRKQRNQSVDVILARVLEFCTDKNEMMSQFQELGVVPNGK